MTAVGSVRALALALILTLAACQQASRSADAVASAAAQPAAAVDLSIPENLLGASITHEGLGPIRVGMDIDEVRRIVARPLEDAHGGDYAPQCEEFSLSSERGVVGIMTRDRRVVDITVHGPDLGVRTPDGIGLGSSGESVRRAYPNAERAHAPYVGEPDYDLYVWASPERAGLRFEVRGERVDTIHAGTGAIRNMEGCL